MEMQDVLNLTNLNWSVRKESLTTESGLVVPKKIAVVREDTNAILGVHGEGYEPYNNSDLLELLYRVNQSTGLEVCAGGSFLDGARVWFQFKSNDLDLGGDTIKGYVSGFNSFDGKTNLAVGQTNVTVSCLNSFQLGYKDVDTKIRHTINMKVKIESILKRIDAVLVEEAQTFKYIKRLSEIPMTPEMEDMVIRTMFQLEASDKIGKLSTRKDNQIKTFQSGLGTELAQKGATAWGLFSGQTFYSSHNQFVSKEKSQLEKMFGKTGLLEQKVFNKLVEMTR